jgi:hypothetical protein
MSTAEDGEDSGGTGSRLWDALDTAASRLWDMPDRQGGDIPESVLAAGIVAGVPDAERDAALWFFCNERAWMAAPPDFMLDECGDSTYDAIRRIAAVLHETITAQGREEPAMTMIAATEIRRRYDLEHGLRDMRDAGITW